MGITDIIKQGLRDDYDFYSEVLGDIADGVSSLWSSRSRPAAKKYAILINGDTEDKHLDNIERAAATLNSAGFDLFVLNPQPLVHSRPDFYVEPNPENLRRLVKEIRSDKDDFLVIYTTGHGNAETKKREAKIAGTEITLKELHDTAGKIPYGSRFVAMDQCYSGDAAAAWFDSSSCFVSPDWKARGTTCRHFAPYLWNHPELIIDGGGDLNNDGFISLQERFSYAAGNYRHFMPHALPLFLPGAEFADRGFEQGNATPPFPAQVVEVSTAEGVKGQLSRLKAGQYAVVDFSATWCGPCREYSPHFDNLARENGGRFLFVRMVAKDADSVKGFGIGAFPTVKLFDHLGRSTKVTNRMKPLESLPAVALSESVALEWALGQIRGGNLAAGLGVLISVSKQDASLIPADAGRVLMEKVVEGDEDSASLLADLVKKRPDIFPKDQLSTLIDLVPDKNESAIFILLELAGSRGELFKKEDVEIIFDLIEEGVPEAWTILQELIKNEKSCLSEPGYFGVNEMGFILNKLENGDSSAGEALFTVSVYKPHLFTQDIWNRYLFLVEEKIAENPDIGKRLSSIASRLMYARDGYEFSGNIVSRLLDIAETILRTGYLNERIHPESPGFKLKFFWRDIWRLLDNMAYEKPKLFRHGDIGRMLSILKKWPSSGPIYDGVEVLGCLLFGKPQLFSKNDIRWFYTFVKKLLDDPAEKDHRERLLGIVLKLEIECGGIIPRDEIGTLIDSLLAKFKWDMDYIEESELVLKKLLPRMNAEQKAKFKKAEQEMASKLEESRRATEKLIREGRLR